MNWRDLFGSAVPDKRERKRSASSGPKTVSRETLLATADALEQLTASRGWQVALDLMEKRMDGAEYAMLASKSSDLMEMLGLQRRARAYREMFDGIQQDIQRTIREAKESEGE